MHNSFSAISSHASLSQAWKRVLGNSRPNSRFTLGADRLCINDYRADDHGFIASISAELRQKRFKFSPLVPHLLPKPNGKKRLICVPTVRDRIVQRALLNHLTAKYNTRFANAVSFGFIEGRSVSDAAARARSLRSSHPWVFKTDITSFFDSVLRTRMAEEIKRQIRDRSLHALLIEASCCEIAAPVSESKRQDIAALGIRPGVGLRQGMPLSPFFANLFLDEFDRLIIARGLHAVRYADDLIFFADSEAACRVVHQICGVALDRIGLKVPPVGPGSKSQIFPPCEAAEFLGLGLRPNGTGYELVLMKQQISSIREELLGMGSIDHLLSRQVRLGSLERILNNKVSGYRQAYRCCSNLNELDNELDNIQQKVLGRVYAQLGIDVDALKSAHRTFLGLRADGSLLGGKAAPHEGIKGATVKAA